MHSGDCSPIARSNRNRPSAIHVHWFARRLRATLSRRLRRPIQNWRWASLFLWVSLAVANVFKLTGELKEGIKEREGTKYPMIDQITDIAVIILVFVVLAMLEVCLKP